MRTRSKAARRVVEAMAALALIAAGVLVGWIAAGGQPFGHVIARPKVSAATAAPTAASRAKRPTRTARLARRAGRASERLAARLPAVARPASHARHRHPVHRRRSPARAPAVRVTARPAPAGAPVAAPSPAAVAPVAASPAPSRSSAPAQPRPAARSGDDAPYVTGAGEG